MTMVRNDQHLLLFLLLCITTLHGANSTPGNGSSGNNNPAFTSSLNNPNYNVNQQISFDPIDERLSVSAETESTTFYRDDSSGGDDAVDIGASFDHGKSATTSISEALLCSGGDLSLATPSNVAASMPLSPSSFVAMAEFACATYSNQEGEEESDEDEDDNDDDGHSSMLSNSFLRRALASSNAASAESNAYDSSFERTRFESNRDSESASFGSSLFRMHPAQTKKSEHVSGLSRALGTRGGAAVPTTSDEFIRRLLVAALVTLLYEGVIGHFLEFVKIVMQTSPVGTTYSDAINRITEKGIAGIWDGFIPWGVVQSLGKGGVFGLAYFIALSYLKPLSENGTLSNRLVFTMAGGIAGGFQGYVLSPTLLLKTRVMTNPVFREKMTLWRTTAQSMTIGYKVVQNEGLLTLMKGSNVFATKRIVDWASRYYFSGVFEGLFLQYSASDSLTPAKKVAASLLGGAASTIVTLPLDVLVAETQDAKKAGVKVSPFDTIAQEFKVGGWNGWYKSNMRGFEARLAHVCLTTVAMKTGTSLVYDFLFKKK